MNLDVLELRGRDGVPLPESDTCEEPSANERRWPLDNGKPGKTDQVQWTTSPTGQCQPTDFPDLPDGTLTGGNIEVHEGPKK